MDEKVRRLFNSRLKMFEDMYKLVSYARFEYTENEIAKFRTFVGNLEVYLGAIKKNQAEIDKLDKKIYGTDKEVRELEKRCKEIAGKVYEADKAINDNMAALTAEIKKKYDSVRNEIKYFDKKYNTAYVSESYASFDTKK